MHALYRAWWYAMSQAHAAHLCKLGLDETLTVGALSRGPCLYSIQLVAIPEDQNVLVINHYLSAHTCNIHNSTPLTPRPPRASVQHAVFGTHHHSAVAYACPAGCAACGDG